MRNFNSILILVLIFTFYIQNFAIAKSSFDEYKEYAEVIGKTTRCDSKVYDNDIIFEQNFAKRFSDVDSGDKFIFRTMLNSQLNNYHPTNQECIKNLERFIEILKEFDLSTELAEKSLNKFKVKANSGSKVENDFLTFQRANMCLKRITGFEYPAANYLKNIMYKIAENKSGTNGIRKIASDINREFDSNNKINCKEYLNEGIKFLDKNKFNVLPLIEDLDNSDDIAQEVTTDIAQKYFPIKQGIYHTQDNGDKELILLPYGKCAFLEEDGLLTFSWNGLDGKLKILMDNSELPDSEKIKTGDAFYENFTINGKEYKLSGIGAPTDFYTYVEPGMTGFASCVRQVLQNRVAGM